MKGLVGIVTLLFLSTGVEAQHYSFESIINSERFGHTQLNYPRGITTDVNGKVYVCDSGNSRVFVFKSNGSVERIIPVVAPISADLKAYPTDVAIAPNGNMYVSSFFGIYIFDPGGVAIGSFGTTFGTEPGEFTNAASIVINNAGEVYVSDGFRVQVFSLNGDFLFQFLLQLTPTGSYPVTFGMSFDPAGNLYVVDSFEKRIQIFSSDGVFLNFIPLPASQYAYSNLFDIAIDASFDIYVNDYVINALYKITTPGAAPYHIAGGTATILRTEQPYDLKSVPLGLAVSSSEVLYETSSNTNAVFILNTQNGRPARNLFDALEPGSFSTPTKIVVSTDGNVYVNDQYNSRIQVFDRYGNFRFMFGSSGGIGSGRILNAYSLGIDANFIYVVDYSRLISRFDYAGNFIDSKAFPPSAGAAFAVDDNFIYVTYPNDRMELFDKSWNLVKTIMVNAEPAATGAIWDIASRADKIYVACEKGLKIYDINGSYLDSYSTGGAFLNVAVSDDYIVVGNGEKLEILDLSCASIQALTLSVSISGIAIAGHRIYISDRFQQRILVLTDLPYPAIQLSDMTFNYSDFSVQIPLFSDSPEPITLEATGEALVLLPDQWAYFRSAGEVTLKASQPAGISFRAGTATAKLTIEKAQLEVIPEDKSKIYGDPTPEFTYQLTGFRFDDAMWELDQLPVSNTSADHTTPVGQYPITFMGGNDDNYEFVYKPGVLTVDKAKLLVTGGIAYRNYGDSDPEFSIEYSGFKNSDTVDDLDELAKIAPETTVTSPAGEYPLAPYGASDDSYDFEYTPGLFLINKAPLVAKADDKNMVYGEDAPVCTFQISGFKNGDTESVLLELPRPLTFAYSGSPVGQYPIYFEPGSADNYDFIYENGTVTVNKAQLFVTAESKTRPYGQENPELTLQFTGFKNNQDRSVFLVQPEAMTVADVNTSVGEYEIVITPGEAENYEFIYQSGTLLINKADQQLAFGELASPVLNTVPPFVLEASSDAGLPVRFSVVSGPASVVENSLGLSGRLGTVIVEASQAGNENYNSAIPVSRSFEVIPDPVLGVENLTSGIRVYPNPARSIAFLKIETTSLQEVSLIDSKGVILPVEFHRNEKEMSIDVSALAAGVYVIRLRTDVGKTLMRKLLVVH